MVLGLFSSKPDHPLADAREAKRILAELAGHEPQGAVEEGGNWLESLAAAEGFKLSQRLELILQIDEAVAPQARRLCREYLAQGRVGRAQEQRLWEVNHGYWSQVVSAYANCMARYRLPEKEAELIKPQMPLLHARLVHALAAQLKWSQFRYGPIQSEFWTTIGGIYLSAVDAKLAQKPLVLYPGAPETTIEAEYLKALVFQASSMDKLLPLEIEIAERFIAYFLPFFALIREVRPENVYWADAAKPLPPTRLARLPEVTPTLRFFNGTRALEAVQVTLEQIRAEHRVPPGIPLGDQYEPTVVIPVLEHLALCWAPKPPMRSHARHQIKSSLLVTHGLADIHRRLSGRQGREEAESWVVEDVSLGGMGATAPVARKDWIRIGELIAMQPDGGDNWLLGIIRRYARSGAQQGAVGIETLSKTPRAVVADAGGFQTEAILIDIPVVGEYARMVLAPNALEEKVALLFTLDGLRARLHPRETLETGLDFLVVNFFVQSFS